MSLQAKSFSEQRTKVGERAARRRQHLAQMLDDHGPLTLRELGRKTGIDITTIGADLRAMAGDGIVSKEGEAFQLAEDL